ncbi:MAG: sulfotransferase domain-containing protein [Nocardiopsaceae bacterium]|nr:sulfotransferase domain-containing protein [Nocardiopsaceae bacterium]
MAEIAWIASYPKSGNTWLRFMLHRYLTGEMPVGGGNSTVPSLDDLLRSGDGVDLNGTGPALVKTHFHPGKGVMQLYRPYTTKAVCIVRNPRDVLLSAIRHFGITDMADAQEFAKDFIANDGASVWRDSSGIGTWPESVRDWTEPDVVRTFMPGIDVLAVRYEDMRGDPAGELRKIVDFLDLGRAVDPEEVERTVADTSIEKMRERNVVTMGRLPQIMRRKSGGQDGAGGQRPVTVQRQGQGAEHGPAQGKTAVMSRPEGQGPAAASSLGVPGKLVGEGRTNQSLRHLGDDIEDAYVELLRKPGEFSRCAARFGYDR